MAGESKRTPLPEVVDFQEGPGILAVDFRSSGVPLLRLRNIEGAFVDLNSCNYLDPEKVSKRWKHFQLRAHDLLISTSASLGRVSQVTEAAAGAVAYTGIVRFRPRSERILRDYLRVWLSSREFVEQAEAGAVGSVIRHFGPSHLKKMCVSVPSLRNQQAIGEVGRALDDKIELNRRVAETLEATAQVLFQSWFVDFDPVHAKAEGRPTKMVDEIAGLFPDSFDDGYPSRWTSSPLRDQFQVLSGGTPSKSEPSYWCGDVPWVTPRSMGCSHVSEAADCVTPAAIGNGTRLVPKGSILVMVRGMGLHQGVRISQARRDVTFNQDVKALVPKWLDSSFLLHVLLHHQTPLLAKVRAAGHGTGVLPTDAIEKIKIPVPPADAQERLFSPFRAINERVGLARSQSCTLAALRDTLLPRLISGELRIADAERAVMAVA